MKRRDFCKRASLAAVGVGAVAASSMLPAGAQVTGPATADVAKIYELQAAFHKQRRRRTLT